MTKNLIIICLVALLFSGCRPEDKTNPTPEENFIKYHGGLSDDIAVDMVVDEAAGYFLLVGNSTSNIDGGYVGAQRIYVVKTDLEGNEIETPLYISFGNYGTSASKIRLSNDMLSVFIAGTADTLNRSRMFWAKVNITAAGLELESSDTISIQEEGNENKLVEGIDIIETIDGQLVVLGTEEEVRHITTGANQQKQVVVAKMTATGTEVWKKYQGFVGDDEAAALHQFSNGDFGVVATTDETDDDGNGGKNLQFFLLDSIGGVLGEQTYGNVIDNNTNLDDVATDVIKTSVGFAILGNSDNGGVSVPFIVVLTNNGIKSVGTSLVDEFGLSNVAHGIAQSGGDFIIVGEYPNFDFGGKTKQGEMSFIRTDQSGVIDGFNHYGTQNGNDEGATAITLLDGSIAVLGTTDFGGGRTMLTLMKVNRNGRLNR